MQSPLGMSFTAFGSKLSSTLIGVPPRALPYTFVLPYMFLIVIIHVLILTYCVILIMFAPRVVSCNITLCPILLLLLKPFKTLLINTPLIRKNVQSIRNKGEFKNASS
jgi:hypothetical protein